MFCCFFFFNDTATTEIYTLSLHDALPIWIVFGELDGRVSERATRLRDALARAGVPVELSTDVRRVLRSEEHTSELQSQSNLVCRLLLEKKKIKRPRTLDPELSMDSYHRLF